MYFNRLYAVHILTGIINNCISCRRMRKSYYYLEQWVRKFFQEWQRSITIWALYMLCRVTPLFQNAVRCRSCPRVLAGAAFCLSIFTKWESNAPNDMYRTSGLQPILLNDWDLCFHIFSDEGCRVSVSGKLWLGNRFSVIELVIRGMESEGRKILESLAGGSKRRTCFDFQNCRYNSIRNRVYCFCRATVLV